MTTNGFAIRRGAAAVLVWCTLSGSALAGELGSSGIITDKSFFNGLPNTLIDFETRGNGTPLVLIDGQTMSLPTSEYSAQGALFSSGVNWVNDGTPAFNAAQNLAGLGPNAVPSTAINTFTITFTGTVRSFAVWIANNFMVDANGPSITARDGSNQIIRTESFGNQTGGSPFVDGRVSVADYGYIGIWSQTPIASVTITKNTAIVDNLCFSSEVPAPGVVALPAIGAALFATRRRR